MASKFSRAALVAGIAIAASGLVAVPAEAANGISTANYYVNNPAIGGASNVTPESATVAAAIDTGGSPESILPIPSTGLTWSATASIAITAGEKWNDGTDTTDAGTGNFVPIDGIPVSGSNSDVSVTITDAAISNGGVNDPGIGANSGKPQPVSNAGAPSYSDVTFEYDPVSDYAANGDQPGPETNFAQDIQVPTVAGDLERSVADRCVWPGRSEQHREHPADPGHRVLLLGHPGAGCHDCGQQHQRIRMDGRHLRKSGRGCQQQLQVLPECRDRC